MPAHPSDHATTDDSAALNESPPFTLVNVWTRSSSKYRIRASVLLLVNVFLFLGVTCFAYWIRSGVLFAPSLPGYLGELAETFDFKGSRGITLGHLLMEPISVGDVPMQILILGLLMAAIIAVPILVAILYGFWCSLPFIFGVCFLAVMPWLSITLLGACILASVRPFRTRFRFMSALVGLVPIVVYLALAWHGSEEMMMGRFDPIDRVKFIAPWVMAIVASALVFAIVLSIARLVDYRPGAIAPLLAVMFGLPVGLFEFHVGRDELHYRVLESLDAYYFMPVDATLGLAEKVERRWSSHPLPRPSWEELYESEQQRWQSELDADPRTEQSVLAVHKSDLVDRCDWFVRIFPHSRYALNVLYIKARALDMRVDIIEFRDKKWIRFYDDFPAAASADTWRTIETNGGNSPTRAAALLRLGRLASRQCDMDLALDYLNKLQAEYGNKGINPVPQAIRSHPMDLLERSHPESSLNIRLPRILLEGRQLAGLLRNNQDPLYGYDPLCGTRDSDSLGKIPGYLLLHPRHERYRENLQKLLREYPDCQIEDNVLLALAISTPEFKVDERTGWRVKESPSRIDNLRSLISAKQGDARPEALYRLGVALLEEGESTASAETLHKLETEFPTSPWAEQAARFGSHRQIKLASKEAR
ncbi:MAG: tetratricopeptide repeat protein [Phycisphaerae bacterium]